MFVNEIRHKNPKTEASTKNSTPIKMWKSVNKAKSPVNGASRIANCPFYLSIVIRCGTVKFWIYICMRGMIVDLSNNRSCGFESCLQFPKNSNNFKQNKIIIIKLLLCDAYIYYSAMKWQSTSEGNNNIPLAMYLLICDSFLWDLTVSATRKIN